MSRLPEPIRLPTYPSEILQERWYCFHCSQHRIDANSLLLHLSAHHDIRNPMRGEDYGDGDLVAGLYVQRYVWETEMDHRFKRQMDSLRGANDFVLEAELGDARA